jgi:hypothetical protein
MNSNGAAGGGFSPLRDGYRWSEDGHLMPRRDEEPFVPEGDEPVREGGYQTEPVKREGSLSGAEVAFNRQYIPLLASERRARRGLILQWVHTHDPFVAGELSKQEDREIPFLEELTAAVGKNHANWRLVLHWEARRGDPQARAELAHWLAEASTGDDPQESKRWHEAETALRDLLARGPRERAKAYAIFWVLIYVCKNGCWPTRPMVKAALKETGIHFPASNRGNNDHRFFTGPVLGRVLKGKAGAPCGPRSKKD